MKVALCTIIAKNYLAHARSLCASYLKYHPEEKCYVLIVDTFSGFIKPVEECFQVVSLLDIALPESHKNFCFKYNVTEVATAVKPFFIRWLLENQFEEAVFYLDPDILVTSPLTELKSLLINGRGMILTPHLDKDFPDDGLFPNRQHIMCSGSFNLGFLGIRANPKSFYFLRWLEEKLTNDCIIAHSEGLFVDQKFFDLAINLFEFDIENGTGYNVAYWNLHSRTLAPAQLDDDSLRSNGGPLYFFHFSGYKPELPNIISSHMTRYKLKDRPDLISIFERYRNDLLQNGYDTVKRWPYEFGKFSNGAPITDFVRRFYREFEGRSELPITFDPFRSKTLRWVNLASGLIFSIQEKSEYILRKTKNVMWRLAKVSLLHR